MHTRTGPGWSLLQADYRATCAYVAEQGGADLFAFSPPYCDARTYGANVSWGNADYAALGDAVFAALKPGGHALVNVDAPVREWRKGFGTERGFHPWRLMLDWAERVGFRVPDRLAYGRQGVPGQFVGRFRNDWEPLMWFQRPGGQAYVDSRALAVKAPHQTRPGMRSPTTRGSAHGGDGNDRLNPGFGDGLASGWCVENGMKLPGTLWNYGAINNSIEPDRTFVATNHPARWTYRLAEDLVRCFCPPDGLVVDPFVGAGTTAAASIAWGRQFIGGDLFARQEDGKPWIDVAADVLIERQRQKRLF